MVGHKRMCLYPSLFHDEKLQNLIVLAISTCAYMRGNRIDHKKKVLIQTVFEFQCSYCTLLWKFCGRTLSRCINRLHKRALRIAYKDYESSFEELLLKEDSVTIHQRNLRELAIEMCKISQKLSPEFMWDLVEEVI